MRRFVVIGQRALASPDFSLNDLPSSSGRLDVLVRCLRAALLVSHGLRRDTSVYLVLNGGPHAPKVVRFAGAAACYLRPDERSLALLVQRALAVDAAGQVGFASYKPGIDVGVGGLELVRAETSAGPAYVLDERGRDMRETPLDASGVFYVGDHRGFDPATRAELDERGALAISVGPTSIHAEDALAVLVNELDRALPRAPGPAFGG
jgi:tRNA (pseudouridine54-N1)-methyltransferase